MGQVQASRWGFARMVAGLAVAVSMAAGCSEGNGPDEPPQDATYDSITADAFGGVFAALKW